MSKLFKHGDTRSDGFRFCQYRKWPSGLVIEQWASPEAFDRKVKAGRIRSSEYKKKKRATARAVKQSTTNTDIT